MPGGTACGIKVYNGTSIYQHGVGAGGAQGILDTAANAGLESMLCTDNSTTAFQVPAHRDERGHSVQRFGLYFDQGDRYAQLRRPNMDRRPGCR